MLCALLPLERPGMTLAYHMCHGGLLKCPRKVEAEPRHGTRARARGPVGGEVQCQAQPPLLGQPEDRQEHLVKALPDCVAQWLGREEAQRPTILRKHHHRREVVGASQTVAELSTGWVGAEGSQWAALLRECLDRSQDVDSTDLGCSEAS